MFEWVISGQKIIINWDWLQCFVNFQNFRYHLIIKDISVIAKIIILYWQKLFHILYYYFDYFVANIY